MKKYQSQLTESKTIWLFPKNKVDFIDKLSSVERGQKANFYSYDEYASGINTVVSGHVNLLKGALFIKTASKEHISLSLSQISVCKYIVGGGKHIFDFELKSHGSATLIL